MIPRVLSEWSLKAISEILEKGVFEPEIFDFKGQLPDPRDDNAKKRLRKTCCALANSDGGFIIFGVSDDRSKIPTERLVGLDPAIDFPEHFGNYPQSCSPSIYWDFRNPPLSLSNEKVLHIVHIPRSWKLPHAVGSLNEGWIFMKRTNKGNEGMSIEEIRAGFLGYYEKRLKLQLLRAELVMIKEDAAAAYISDEKDIENQYSLITFDTRIIETLIADTYSITANKPKLLEALSQIRQRSKIANNKINIFYGTATLPMSGKEEMVRSHNEFLQPICEQLQRQCEQAIMELDELLNL